MLRFLLQFIPKPEEDGEFVAGFRPLGILSVMLKWFSGVLSKLKDAYTTHSIRQFGFRAGKQPLEAFEPL